MGSRLKRCGIAIVAMFTLLVLVAGIEPSATSAQEPEVPPGSFVPHTIEDVAHAPGFGEAEADILRLYQAFFSREPDVDGALFWLRRFDVGASLASIADEFAQGPEFSVVYGSLDDEAFVDTAYANVLGRSPDADGRQFWIDELAAGRTRGSVVTLIAGAVEFEGANPFPVAPATTVEELLRAPQFDGEHASALRLYRAFLGRAPDVDGASFWTGEVESGRSIESITEAFSASAEFEALAGADDDAAFVERIYQNVLGRSPDGQGSAFWVGELAAGRSRASVVAEFAKSPEFIANHPFQMAGIETLQYRCGTRPDGTGARIYGGDLLDRMNSRPAGEPRLAFDELDSKPWLERIVLIDVPGSEERLAVPPLSVEPPHLLPGPARPCRPEQIEGPPDGGWLDRALRRQQDGPPRQTTGVACSVRDDVSGPVATVVGVESNAPAEFFANGESVLETLLRANQSKADEATVLWSAERGLIGNNGIVPLPVGGGPGDDFDVVVSIDGASPIECGRAGRLATLPEPDPIWSCESVLAGAAVSLRVSFPDYVFIQLYRDGVLIADELRGTVMIDRGAQLGSTHRYEMRVLGDGQPTVGVQCGSLTLPPDTLENRILVAEESFFGDSGGPYLYGSIAVLDGGVPVQTLDIGYFFSADPEAGDRAYDLIVVDDDRVEIEPVLPAGHPGIFSIRDVYQALIDADAAGRDVEVTFNERAIPVRWTIDGQGVEFLCLEADTATPDIRSTEDPWCVGMVDDVGIGPLVPRR